MGLLRALSIEKGEGTSVALMMAQSFFLGAFIMTFQISANAMFLKEVGGDSLTLAYLISGIMGMTLTLIFSFLQKRIPFRILAIATYLIVAVSTIGLWWSFHYHIFSDYHLVYFVFLIVGPFIALVAYITFWGVMGRIFNLKQAKRLFGLIDSGQILAMILVSFAIPFLTNILPNTKDLVLISGASLAVAFFIQIIVSFKYGSEFDAAEKASSDDGGGSASEAKISKYLKNPYIVMMALFVFISMLVQFFVEFSFMKTVNNQYPGEHELTNFFGFFMGTLLIFSFVFKSFLYGKLIQMYGLKVNLLILPIVLVFFTVIAAIMGTLDSYEGAPNTFVLFFMFIISSKLFAQSLRVSIEVPAFKTFYQPLDRGIRFDVQSRIDGFVNELSATLGGAILWILELAGFKLIHFSWLLIPIIGLWAYLTFRLYDRYQITLRESLSNIKSGLNNAGAKVAQMLGISSLLQNQISASDKGDAINAIKISNQLSPVLYLEALTQSLESNNTEIRSFAAQQLNANNEFRTLNTVKDKVESENQEGIRSELFHLMEEANQYSNNKIDDTRLIRMARSKKKQDRINLCKILTLEAYKENRGILAELLRDVDPKVRKEAIMSVVKLKEEELYLPMIDNLAKNEYRNSTIHAILALGKDILEALNTSFYKAGFNGDTLVLVVDLIGEINGEKSQDYLEEKLTVPDMQVVDAVMIALHKCGYQASEEQKGKIIQAIDDTIGVTMWNFASSIEAKKHKLGQDLSEAINLEIKSNFDHIFLLLGLIYDTQSIKHIKQNIESGTAEGISFAIELLDIFVDEQLKQKLFPILDDITPEEKVSILQPFYPRFELTKEESLKSILNRSYTEINRWSRICAIQSYKEMENGAISDDLVAHIFNPDYGIREAAGLALRKIDLKKYREVSYRLEDHERVELNEKVNDIEQGNALSIFELVKMLLEIPALSNCSGNHLVDLAEHMNQMIYLEGDAVLSLTENDNKDFLKVIWKGKVSIKDTEGNLLNSFKQGEIFSSYQLQDYQGKGELKMICEQNTSVYSLDGAYLYQLLVENDKLANAVLQVLNGNGKLDSDIKNNNLESVVS